MSILELVLFTIWILPILGVLALLAKYKRTYIVQTARASVTSKPKLNEFSRLKPIAYRKVVQLSPEPEGLNVPVHFYQEGHSLTDSGSVEPHTDQVNIYLN